MPKYDPNSKENIKEREKMGCIVMVIILVIVFIIFAASGNIEGFFKWGSR